jgi:hypothetical protein
METRINELENELFARWSQKHEGLFIEDGAPCPEQFENEKTRVTFVLKEANASGESWDMRSWAAESGGDLKSPNTWNNIVRWTQAILDGGEFPEKVSIDDRIRWLKRISFMNLKKVGGDSSSIPSEIIKYAKNDAEEIREQLCIYKPDIIVCCGVLGSKAVADCLGDFVFKYEGAWGHYEKNGVFCWFYTQIPAKLHKTAVLSFYHPRNLGTGCSDQVLYDAMLEAAKEALAGRPK